MHQPLITTKPKLLAALSRRASIVAAVLDGPVGSRARQDENWLSLEAATDTAPILPRSFFAHRDMEIRQWTRYISD